MSLTMSLPTAESMNSGGTFLQEPGKYHFSILHAEENPTRNEKLVKGFMFELAVQAPANMQGMTFRAYFTNGDPAHKDGGAFALSKQVAALIAANVVTPSDLGKANVEINAGDAKDHQVVAELSLGKPSERDGKRYLDVAYANIFHVDDPRAKAYPKDANALEWIPKACRRDEAFFAPLLVKKAPAPKMKDEDFDGL